MTTGLSVLLDRKLDLFCVEVSERLSHTQSTKLYKTFGADTESERANSQQPRAINCLLSQQ